ncbi:MAG: alpha/beta hydrolase fold domain-containing protein [Actinobacteria bacterium]|nr:alpha/beta hydrolase fold domain-containing protein [Actinomycetota bacterium]MCL6105539.1 alpha/beta hydrolase fold domain-containing protein [Actinomycetota bacterium]
MRKFESTMIKSFILMMLLSVITIAGIGVGKFTSAEITTGTTGANLQADSPPLLGPAPNLPTAGTCNSGPLTPTCCPSSSPGVNFYGNLLYGHDINLNTNLYLDAYLPQSTNGPVPAVIYVHGGAFIGGSKCNGGTEQIYMAQHGLAVFSIDYPLATTTQPTFTEAPADTQLSVQWVRTYASSLGVMANKLALWGTSAGAPIAFDAAYEAQLSDAPARVQAIAGWSGPYDWVTFYYADAAAQPAATQAAEEYIGCSNMTDSPCFGNLLGSSPITHVTRGDPPSLLVTSTDAGTSPGQCEIINPQNTVEMATALTTHGVAVTVQTTSACAHSLAYANDPISPPGSGTMLENTTTWLEQQLDGNPISAPPPSPLPPPITGVTLITPPSTCLPPAGSAVTYTPNIVYGNDFNSPLYLDAYLPQTISASIPAVVVVHGGGHISGDKCDVATESIALAQHGIAAFAVDYPLATQTQPTFPNPVYDVMNAVSWVRSNANLYKINPNEIGLWGGSAGGNLALSAALSAPFIQPSAIVQAVASWSGTTDTFELIGEYQQNSGFNLANTSWAEYIGCSDPWSQTWNLTANICLNRFEEASPAQFIDPSPSQSPSDPPILVAASSDFTGVGTCEIVPPRQAEEVQQRANSEILTVQMDINNLCAHAFAYYPTEFPSTLSFFDTHLVSTTTYAGSAYIPLTPARIVDTRCSTYPQPGLCTGENLPNANSSLSTLSAKQTLSVEVAGLAEIPTTASAVVLNITAIDPTASGYLTVWPAGEVKPTASSLNYTSGETVPNLSEVALGTTTSCTGCISIYSYASSDVVVDVEGYYGPPSGGATFSPITPYRICDTRVPKTSSILQNQCNINGASPIGAKQTLNVEVSGYNSPYLPSGQTPVPTTASAVVLNVTAIDPTTSGYLTVWPEGLSQPTASNLNFTSGETVPNAVVVPLSTGSSPGEISIYNFYGNTDVTVDVTGYFSASTTGVSFVGTAPYRACDTRDATMVGYATPCSGSPLVSSTPLTLSLAGIGPIPSNAKAVVVNVTAIDPTASGYITVWPKGLSQPTVSNLNFVAGEVIANSVTVALSASGDISIGLYQGSANLVVDVTGWYV